MKKLLMIIAVAAATLTASAQVGFYGNKFFDNWYIGLNGGIGSKTTHQAVLKNLNGNAGLRIGKWITPSFGLAAEGNAYFGNLVSMPREMTGLTEKTAVRYSQVNLLATVNMMNAIGGYKGEPRLFEVILVPGLGWGHNYGFSSGTTLNMLVSKLAIDFAFNFGKNKEWQAYIEPSINYMIDGTLKNAGAEKVVRFDINSSFLQLNAGINYKFKTSNGTHNFLNIQACDQSEIDALNARINGLEQENAANKAKAALVEQLRKEIADLQSKLADTQGKLNECENKPAEVTPGLPSVFYQLNKSVITPAQAQNVAIAAEILKKHPEMKIQIKGYASPEGPKDNNTSLGIRRANAVKDLLIKKYNISPDRITAEGCGETDKLFEIYEFNRVAMLYLEK